MILLAQGEEPKGPEFGGSSPIGLVVTLLLLVAVILLVRSMNKHLKKVPDSFDPEPEETGSTPGTVPAADASPAEAAPPRVPTDPPPPSTG